MMQPLMITSVVFREPLMIVVVVTESSLRNHLLVQTQRLDQLEIAAANDNDIPTP